MSDESSKATDDTVPADPEEPMYEQLGEAGNPFEKTEDNLEGGRETERPDINPQTDDEVDRAAHYD